MYILNGIFCETCFAKAQIFRLVPYTCWICNLRKATTRKINWYNPLGAIPKTPRWFLLLLSTVSLRVFSSALDIGCATTSYPFGFPTKNKFPPIEILWWLIGSLRSMGYVVNFIWVDEGGELAKSLSDIFMGISLKFTSLSSLEEVLTGYLNHLEES